MLKIFLCIILGLWIMRFMITVIYRRKFLKVPDNRNRLEPMKLPKLSVIIPVRNEESNIGPLLETLTTEDYAPLEILIVDDCSTDRTAEIAVQFTHNDQRIRIIQGEPLAKGWLGKPHALHQGVLKATGDFYLFIDADTRHHTGSIKKVISFALEKEADMLTIIPQLVCKSFWEKVVQPVFLSWFGGLIMARINNPLNRDALAVGPYMLVSKVTYDKIGGFSRFKNSILEDLEFARAVKSEGCRLILAYGPDIYSLRMYSGFKNLWQGWTKTFTGGLTGKPYIAAGLILFIFLTSIMPFFLFIYFLFNPCELIGDGILSAAIIFFIYCFRLSSDIFYKQNPFYILSHPLGKSIVIAILAWAIIRQGDVKWKDREYRSHESDVTFSSNT